MSFRQNTIFGPKAGHYSKQKAVTASALPQSGKWKRKKKIHKQGRHVTASGWVIPASETGQGKWNETKQVKRDQASDIQEKQHDSIQRM